VFAFHFLPSGFRPRFSIREMILAKLIKKQEKNSVVPFGFQAISRTKVQALGSAGSRNGASSRAEGSAGGGAENIEQQLMEIERKAQQVEKEAYEKGYAQGEKDGFEYGSKTLEVLKDQIGQLIGGIQELPAQVFRDYREWLVTAALTIARHIVRRELTISRETIVKTVEALLNEAEEHSSLTLYLNPDDLEFFKKMMDLVIAPNSSKHFAIRTDPAITSGGCRIESDIQLLDATLETQFAGIAQSLRETGLDLEDDPT
jgi:flagellar assembly protein FliH